MMIHTGNSPIGIMGRQACWQELQESLEVLGVPLTGEFRQQRVLGTSRIVDNAAHGDCGRYLATFALFYTVSGCLATINLSCICPLSRLFTFGYQGAGYSPPELRICVNSVLVRLPTFP